MNRTTTLAFLLFIFAFNFNSQSQEKCGSHHILEEELKNNPERAKAIIIQEEKLQKLIEQKKNSKNPEEVYTIPLVVHVIHLGENVGVGNNISDSQVISGVNQINDAFRNINGQGTDVRIQFQLATFSPDCEATNGIVRVDASGLTEYVNNGVQRSSVGIDENEIRALSRWSPDKYYNVYLISQIDGNGGGSGIQGYARFPGGNSSFDDTFILNNAWGDHGSVLSWKDKGTVGIHELGHALNLYHTFEGDDDGNSCPAETNGCGSGAGDCCDDTSPHIRSASNCPSGDLNTCTGVTNDDVIENYMDYSSENCMTKFSNDQKLRMRVALEDLRPGLINSKGLSENYIDFSTPVATNCTPVTVNLDALYMGIKQVTFNDLNHQSGYASQDNELEGNLDLTGECINSTVVNPDSTYNLFVEGLLNPNQIKVWIDYNNDGEFNTSNELLTSQSIGSKESFSVPITIPNDAVMDEMVRMRVMNDLNSFSNACHNPVYGQAIDYSIMIAEPSVTDTLEADFSSSTSLDNVCVGDTVFLNDATNGNVSYWEWNISNGFSSNDQNPWLVITELDANNSFNVSLRVGNENDTAFVLKENFINTDEAISLDIDAGFETTYDINAGNIVLSFATPTSGTYSGTGVSNGEFNPMNAGAGEHNILYTYETLNGCSDTISLNLNVINATSDGQELSRYIKLYPNPVDGILNIEWSNLNSTPESIQIISITGQVVKSLNNTGSNIIQVNTEKLQPGSYVVQIITNENDILNHHLIVR